MRSRWNLWKKPSGANDTLIESIEKQETAEEISALLGIPTVTIKEHAEAIVNILLFNKEDDPYLSFGLNTDAPLSEVSRRWKSLIVLYHPTSIQISVWVKKKRKRSMNVMKNSKV